MKRWHPNKKHVKCNSLLKEGFGISQDFSLYEKFTLESGQIMLNIYFFISQNKVEILMYILFTYINSSRVISTNILGTLSL